MKYRAGWVSNSSTSSFIVVGYKLKVEEFHDHYEDWEALADDLGLGIISDDYEAYIGKILGYSESGEVALSELTESISLKALEDLKEKDSLPSEMSKELKLHFGIIQS